MDSLGIETRRLGTGLLAFGLVGVVLAGVVAVGLIAGAIAARNLDERVAGYQAELAASLEAVSTSMDRLETATANGSDTILTTSQTVSTASTALGVLSDLSEELSRSLDVSILGQRPFAGAAARFGQLAEQVDAVQQDTDRLASNLATNAVDVSALAAEVSRLQVRLDTLTARIAGFDSTGELVSLVVAGILLIGLLVAWLAIGAAFCAWAGWRLRRAATAVSEAGSD